MYYTGVGSRNTPGAILDIMFNIGRFLGEEDLYDIHDVGGWVLRTGGAQGADEAFERGAQDTNGRVELYLPWYGFNGRRTGYAEFSPKAMEIAATFHPAWHRCSSGARRLHARNVYQILGKELTAPSSMVVCWTPNAAVTGGTGMAIRIARAHSVPVYNLGSSDLNQVRAAIYRHVRSYDRER